MSAGSRYGAAAAPERRRAAAVRMWIAGSWWVLLMLAMVLIAGPEEAVRAQTYTMQVSRQPAGARGGEPFDVQPIVVILADGVLDTSFSGDMFATIGSTPTGFETLQVNTTNSFAIVEGEATFTDLYIDTAGSGYTIDFTARRTDLTQVATVESSSFTVNIGDVYTLQVDTPPGTATGGTAFSTQPVVSFVDRGGNTVASADSIQVSAALGENPTGDTLLPSAFTTVTSAAGIATFLDLYINAAGNPYTIIFTSAEDLPGGSSVESSPFAVGIGSAGSLRFVTDMTSGRLEASRSFGQPVRISIEDVGGNRLVDDSSSGVTATIINNPEDANLLPSDFHFRVARNGLVTFPRLELDKVGAEYALRFTYSSYDDITTLFTEDSTVFVDTPSFDVEPGDPTSLLVLQTAEDSYAGGQPFASQPIAQVSDYGGNAIVDEVSKVSAFMVSSLGTGPDIEVSTANAPNTSIVSVTSDRTSGFYGVGDVIQFILSLTSEVQVTGFPVMRVNVSTTNGRNVRNATFVGDPSGGTFSSTLSFAYAVQDGDSTDRLAYANFPPSALQLNGSVIVDTGGRAINRTLPVPGSANSFSGSVSIAIVADLTVVENLTSTHPNGEYGAGEEVNYYLTFSDPVHVQGRPYLSVTAFNITNITRTEMQNQTSLQPVTIFNTTTVNGTEVTTNHTEIQNVTSPVAVMINESRTIYGRAVYHSGSGTRTVRFVYTVGVDDRTTNLTLRNQSIQYDAGDKILRDASTPTQPVNPSIPGLRGFNNRTAIVIDTEMPVVDLTRGVFTTKPDGRYLVGEQIHLYVAFTKPVALVGENVRLLLDTGLVQGQGDFDTVNTTVNETLFHFIYTVGTFEEAAQLEIDNTTAAIELTFDTTIRRASTNPTTIADTDLLPALAVNKGLRPRHNIEIFGVSPSVSSVHLFDASRENDTITTDDTVLINVTFTALVIVSGSPVLVLDVDNEREATYHSGNLTDTLVFEYTVLLTDVNDRIAHRYTPNALCLETGCPDSSSNYIRAYSENPTADADLTLSLSGGNIFTGVPFAEMNVSGRLNQLDRQTTVTGISIDHGTGEVGVGEALIFYLSFTDEITWFGDSPELLLSNGEYAPLLTGESTNTLQFFYITTENDSFNSSVRPATYQVIGGQDTAIRCDCNLTNLALDAVNTSMLGLDDPPTLVWVNSTKPIVTDIYSRKITSPYDGVYMAGETIVTYVEFSKEVHVRGTPELYLALGGAVGDSSAVYDEALSDTFRLAFTYTVVAGDFSHDLEYTSTDALRLPTADDQIQRFSTYPTTDANISLPAVAPIGRNGTLAIDARNNPYVVNVTSPNDNGAYTAGDEIVVYVIFSHFVQVLGGFSLYMELGLSDVTATYNATLSPDPKTLAFVFTPSAGHETPDLDYVDEFSLDRETVDGVEGEILALSAAPVAVGNIDLPVPGENGSLSFNKRISIDTSTPYITDIYYLTESGVYSTADTILFNVTFSTEVAVSGSPSILLETGTVDRAAVYTAGSGSRDLTFGYTPRPGDSVTALDYASDENNFRSAVDSFQMNGGYIRRLSSNPSLDADVHLNPPDGTLAGELLARTELGVAEFVDLAIAESGAGYKVRLEATPTSTNTTVTADTDITVLQSAEYELTASPREVGALFGASIAIDPDQDGGIVVVGEPFRTRSINEVQLITTSASTDTAVTEIQVVVSNAIPASEVQTFQSTADAGETVGGTFRLKFGSLGITRAIHADVTADTLETILENDIPDVEDVLVTRVPYTFCACNSAFEWTITFVTLQGVIPTLKLRDVDLTGSGASFSDVTVLQDSTFLGGTFVLSLDGESTAAIAYDASAAEMQDALEASLPVDIREVVVSQPDEEGGKRWQITFGAMQADGEYDIAQLEPDDSLLTGNGASVTVFTGREGGGPLTGNFSLSWRNEGPTDTLSFRASAAEVEAALESLPTIDDVTVVRSEQQFGNGYTWTVTFLEVRTLTDYGYLAAGMENLDAIVAHSDLVGADAAIDVSFRYGNEQVYPPWSDAIMGTDGPQAGQVNVYQADGLLAWVNAGSFRADDVDAYDWFGHSVSVSGTAVIVGAPGNERENDMAVSPHNESTSYSVRHGVVGSAYIYRLLPCTSNTTCYYDTLLETQLYPPEAYVAANEHGGEFGWAVDVRKRIAVVGAPGEDGTRGAVYVYEYSANSAAYNANASWTLLDRIDSSSFSHEPEDRFGHSVAISSNGILVGAPGYRNDTGAAYLFVRSGSRYSLFQRFLLDDGVPGDLFGWSVDMEADTIVIGAYGLDDMPIYTGVLPTTVTQIDCGGVFVYYRPTDGELWLLQEKLTATNVKAADHFGQDVSLNGNVLVATSLQSFTGELGSQRAIMTVTTSATPNAQALGSVFQLSWKRTNTSSTNGEYNLVTTRGIAHDVTAVNLKDILEEDLATGELSIKRSRVDSSTGGYTWTITFVEQTENVPALEADAALLSGTNPTVTVVVTNPIPRSVRGLAHAFVREAPGDLYVENALLFPQGNQRQELCGASVAVGALKAAVGCPNRDRVKGGLNAGAATVYDLKLLRVNFTHSSQTAIEGEQHSIHMARRDINAEGADDLIVYRVRSLERNPDSVLEAYVGALFDLEDDPLRATVLDQLGVGTAFGRTQYYGSYENRSQWIEGMYDYRGVSDYEEIHDSLIMFSGTESIEHSINITDDDLLEIPDENISLALVLPGVFPSALGPLRATVTIVDNGDGVTLDSAKNVSFDKVFSNDIEREDGFGSAIDVDTDAQLAIVGAPRAMQNGLARAGAAYVYTGSGGVWTQIAKLKSRDPLYNGRFGEAVALQRGYGRISSVIAVGEPGAASVTVYRYTEPEVTGASLVFEAVLQHRSSGANTLLPEHGFGGAGSIGVFHDVVAVGAPGVETVYVFERLLNISSTTIGPTFAPTPAPSVSFAPTVENRSLTDSPTNAPTTVPTAVPTSIPSALPTAMPTADPTQAPTAVPTFSPTPFASAGITRAPTPLVTSNVTDGPTSAPTTAPSPAPTQRVSLSEKYDWQLATQLHSSDYDYDVINGVTYLHEDFFGTSVAVYERTIVVGAPDANGNAIGTQYVDEFDTQAAVGSGTGRAYVFYRDPHQQSVTLRGDLQQIDGTFILSLYHRSVNATTDQVSFGADAATMETALESLSNIDDVDVTLTTTSATSQFEYVWTVTFISEMEDPPLLVPGWSWSGCPECTPLSFNMTDDDGNVEDSIVVAQVVDNGEWKEHTYLEADDSRPGERFGSSVALQEEHVVVGAPVSAAVTSTTWDFETGDLIGWTVTGDAFDFQPTYGDNSMFRAVYGGLGNKYSGGSGEPSHMKGRYYVGTYEQRPGNGTAYYHSADPDYSAGSAQGDEPVGTLTSQVFMILGTEITFLVGGGCDATRVYVELLVDGVTVARDTGGCSETMRSKSWDVAPYRQRAAQIRVVDDIGSGKWGHINVDHFEFDWDIDGGRLADMPTSFEGDDVVITQQRARAHRLHAMETPRAGAAYIFRRADNTSMNLDCAGNRSLCAWYQLSRLTASDKRANERFGSAVRLDEDNLIVAVGAPRAHIAGMYRETPAEHPHTLATPLSFPITDELMPLMMLDSTHTTQPNAARAVWLVSDSDARADPDPRLAEEGGAVYMYTWTDPVIGSGETVLTAAQWPFTERSRIQPSDASPRDHFGAAVALHGFDLLVGSPLHDAAGHDAGAVYTHDARFHEVSFSSQEYYAVEGTTLVDVTLERTGANTDPLTLHYSTSDLTATAIDSVRFDDCLDLALLARDASCGDYEQSSGYVSFDEGSTTAVFQVRIMDNPCREHYAEYVQLTLAVPGSKAILGESYSAILRIDDDDWLLSVC